MEKINLVELLKDCIGIELDCAVFDDVTLYRIDTSPENEYPIRIETKSGNFLDLTKYGTYLNLEGARCVIFPKGKTTWEGFVPPCEFKDGDVLSYQCAGLRNRTIYIYRHHPTFNTSFYVALDGDDLEFMVNHKEGIALSGYNTTARLATEEEKQKLFDAIKAKGYKWNSETKTLEKLTEPNFHKSDWVIDKQGLVHQIENVVENVTNHTFGYDIVGGGYFNENSDVRLWTIQDAEDGDILVDKYNNIGIFQECIGICWHSYIYLGCNGELLGFNIGGSHEQTDTHPATEEEKQKLFDVIKANGYKWNAETKTLEKLNELKFKDGDILYCNANDDGEDKDMFKYIFIFDKIVDVDGTQFYYSHCHLFGNKFYETKANLVHGYPVRFATEEEKQKLFQAIKDNGYHWNSETKTLDKLIKLNFKTGNKIRNIKTGQIHTVTHTYGSNKSISFQVDNCGYSISHEFQDEYELVPDKFDINTLKPFDKVLVRNTNNGRWCGQFYMSYDKNEDYPFECTYNCWMQCIPYEGNEHLRGKTEDCDEYFKTWEKTGD